MARKVVSVQCAICNREDSLYFADRDGGLVACGYCAVQRADAAERERDELREIINASDWHGCVSGDCPHDREALCVERLGIDIAKAEAATTLAYADALHMVSRQMDSIIGAEDWQNRILQLPAQLRRLRDAARRQGGGEGA